MKNTNTCKNTKQPENNMKNGTREKYERIKFGVAPCLFSHVLALLGCWFMMFKVLEWKSLSRLGYPEVFIRQSLMSTGCSVASMLNPFSFWAKVETPEILEKYGGLNTGVSCGQCALVLRGRSLRVKAPANCAPESEGVEALVA